LFLAFTALRQNYVFTAFMYCKKHCNLHVRQHFDVGLSRIEHCRTGGITGHYAAR